MTYQERVNEMATKLAKLIYKEHFDDKRPFEEVQQSEKDNAVELMKPLAILAIAESAEVARKAYYTAFPDNVACTKDMEDQYLTDNGLTPQN